MKFISFLCTLAALVALATANPLVTAQPRMEKRICDIVCPTGYVFKPPCDCVAA